MPSGFSICSSPSPLPENCVRYLPVVLSNTCTFEFAASVTRSLPSLEKAKSSTYLNCPAPRPSAPMFMSTTCRPQGLCKVCDRTHNEGMANSAADSRLWRDYQSGLYRTVRLVEQRYSRVFFGLREAERIFLRRRIEVRVISTSSS